MHTRAQVGPVGGKKAGKEADRAAGCGVLGRIVASAGEVRQFQRTGVDGHAPRVGERPRIAGVVEMAVREHDCPWPRACAVATLDGPPDVPRETRQAGVDERPGAARQVHRIEIHEDRRQPAHARCDVREQAFLTSAIQARVHC